MEKDLSHQIDVDVEILLGGVDLVMAQHLFNLINGPPHVEEVLGIGVAQSVGGERQPCTLHRFADALCHTEGLHRGVGERDADKEMPRWTLRSGGCQVSGKGFDRLLWKRQSDGIVRFSVGKGQFSFTERDILQSDGADLYRPQAQGIGQEDDSIGSDIGGRGQRQGSKEGLYFLGAQELGRLLLSKATGSHEQRSQVFLHHSAFPMQVPQESPKTIPMDVACGPRDLLLCQKTIEFFNLQLRQSNAMLFKVIMERGQNAFHQSEVIGRNPVGL